MNERKRISLVSLAMLAALVIAFVANVDAQEGTVTNPKKEVASQKQATLTAALVDAEKKAQQKAATVEVKTTGIELIDPAKVNEMAKVGQGHLHYQVDGGPVIATTATKLSFHGLTPGSHKIVVMLAGNDHNPLGPQQTLEITIP